MAVSVTWRKSATDGMITEPPMLKAACRFRAPGKVGEPGKDWKKLIVTLEKLASAVASPALIALLTVRVYGARATKRPICTSMLTLQRSMARSARKLFGWQPQYVDSGQAPTSIPVCMTCRHWFAASTMPLFRFTSSFREAASE